MRVSKSSLIGLKNITRFNFFMCAIFGIIGKNNDYLLKKISESQIYRGPDEQNFFIDKEKSIHLGSNRLAVVRQRRSINQCFLRIEITWLFIMGVFLILLK